MLDEQALGLLDAQGQPTREGRLFRSQESSTIGDEPLWLGQNQGRLCALFLDLRSVVGAWRSERLAWLFLERGKMEVTPPYVTIHIWRETFVRDGFPCEDFDTAVVQRFFSLMEVLTFSRVEEFRRNDRARSVLDQG